MYKVTFSRYIDMQKCILSELFIVLLCRTFIGMPDEQREGLQEELIDIILRVLKRNPQLHYYQGYHDIVVTFLLVVKERLATALVEKLSTHHLRYFYIMYFYFTVCLHNMAPCVVAVDTNVHTISPYIKLLLLFYKFRNCCILYLKNQMSHYHDVTIYSFFIFRDFMDPTMDNTKHILNYLMPIIERVNPEVHDFMQQ